MSTVTFRPRLTLSPPQTYRAITTTLGWPEKVITSTWRVLMTTTDPATKSLAATFLVAQERIRFMSYDELVHFTMKVASPRSLVRILELSVQEGAIKRRQCAPLETLVLSFTDRQGAWKK